MTTRRGGGGLAVRDEKRRGRRKRVLVLGGGFAGVECTRRLERRLGDGAEVVLVSEDNFMLFTPMLPQVASGMIETRHIIMPIRTITDKAVFYEGRVRNIDLHGKMVNLWGNGGRRGIALHYDCLVVALGSETNFFGMGDLERNAYRMKTLGDAVMVRNRVIDMLEQAENEQDPVLRRRLLTFVVVGGGFAGVETAGELVDLLSDATRRYPNVSREDVRVMILEALPRILPGFPDGLAGFAQDKLAQRGVEIMLETSVTGFDGEEVAVVRGDGRGRSTGAVNTPPKPESIQAKTVVWTAGVTPTNTIRRSLFKTQKGKIVVDDMLEARGFEGVFAIGDCAMFVDSGSKRPLPPTAQIAEAQAKVAAHNIEALFKNGEKKRFVYRSRGQMAVIGKRTGVAMFFGMNIHGLLAWILWRNVYLSKIPSWNKRFRVLLDWTADMIFGRDISRLKFIRRESEKSYRDLDEVDDVW